MAWKTKPLVRPLKKTLFLCVSSASRKKSSSTNGQTIKRGGKGRAIKEKRTFFEFLKKNLLPFKKLKLFYLRTLIELWTYHVKVCRLSKSVFGYFKTKEEKKVPMAIKFEGGGASLRLWSPHPQLLADISILCRQPDPPPTSLRMQLRSGYASPLELSDMQNTLEKLFVEFFGWSILTSTEHNKHICLLHFFLCFMRYLVMIFKS